MSVLETDGSVIGSGTSDVTGDYTCTQALSFGGSFTPA
jgi:hypothetical protein